MWQWLNSSDHESQEGERDAVRGTTVPSTVQTEHFKEKWRCECVVPAAWVVWGSIWRRAVKTACCYWWWALEGGGAERPKAVNWTGDYDCGVTEREMQFRRCDLGLHTNTVRCFTTLHSVFAVSCTFPAPTNNNLEGSPCLLATAKLKCPGPH